MAGGNASQYIRTLRKNKFLEIRNLLIPGYGDAKSFVQRFTLKKAKQFYFVHSVCVRVVGGGTAQLRGRRERVLQHKEEAATNIVLEAKR